MPILNLQFTDLLPEITYIIKLMQMEETHPLIIYVSGLP
jgi:hypothetical protein